MGTGIELGSCTVSQSQVLLVRTLPGSCAGLCSPLDPGETTPVATAAGQGDWVAAAAALSTRGRWPSAKVFPSSLETS